MATSSSRADAVEIAVIGSARIDSADVRYSDAWRLGRSLAEEGWTVVTGGYGGLMAATSSGARATGGRTVGLPMSDWSHLVPHESNAEVRWSADYPERLGHLLAADVVVALPGGIGTLSEAAVVWAAAQTEPEAAQLVLVGPEWADVHRILGSRLVVGQHDLDLVPVVDDVDEVVPTIRRLLTADRAAPEPRG